MANKKYSDDEFDIIKLRLRLIKENYDYQMLFETFKAEYEKWRPRPIPIPVDVFKKYGISGIVFSSCPADTFDIYHVLDPVIDTEKIDNKILNEVLPRLFKKPGLYQVFTDNRDIPGGERSAPLFLLEKTIEYQLYQFRLLAVDMRQNKGQLIKEFGEFLDEMDARRSLAEQDPSLKKYYNWQVNNTRWSEKIKKQLLVWDLAKDGLTHKEIAAQLNETVDKVSKIFQVAFLRTQKEKYTADKFKLIIKKRLCPACKKYLTCHDPGECKKLNRFLKDKNESTSEMMVDDFYGGYDLNTIGTAIYNFENDLIDRLDRK